MTTNRFIAALFTALLLLPGAASAAEGAAHRLALHVDESDPARMNLALNNALNVAKHYSDKGEEVEIRIVAYGPGLTMLIADASPVADRVKSIAESVPQVTFEACGNTKANMEKKSGKEITLLDHVTVVPSGVVTLMEYQEQGWSYVRP